MGLTVRYLEDKEDDLKVIATERLWLTADRKHVVRDGDPKAANLLTVAGREIPAELVEKFDLDDNGLPPYFRQKHVYVERADGPPVPPTPPSSDVEVRGKPNRRRKPADKRVTDPPDKGGQ